MFVFAGVFVFVYKLFLSVCSGSICVRCIPDRIEIERLMCEVEFWEVCF